MKLKPVFIIIFLVFFSFSFSQNIDFEGVITDTFGNTILGANIIAVEKNTQILDGFGISNDSGYFRLTLKKDTDYDIKISFIGFQQITFVLNKTADFKKDFKLEQQAEALDEVELVYEMPVTIRGDTIIYNADSFNTGTERKLGDVLKNMPGIEINDDGRIEVEGKEVTKITVEGKDFFDGDSKLATQNLPANVVGKVQVLRNFSEVDQLRSVTNNEDNIAINISLKSGKDKFWFGEITAGAGNEDRFIVAPKLFYYAKDMSMSILGNSNNIGDPPLSRRDFYKFGGGFGNLNARTGTSIDINSDDAGLSSLQNNRAKSIDAQLGAYNFSISPNEALEISGFAILAKTKNQLENKVTRTYTASDAVEETLDFIFQENEQQLYKFTTKYQPNENLQTEYNLLIKSSRQNELTDLTSISGRGTNQVMDQIDELKSQNPSSINQELKAYYTLNEDHIFSFEAQHLSQKEDPFYRATRGAQPFVNILPLNTNQSRFNINQNREIKTNKMEGKLDYFYILTPKSNLNFTFGITDVNQDFNSSIFQVYDNKSENYFIEANLSNQVNFKFRDIYVAMHYRFITGIFTFDPGVTLHSYKTATNQLGKLISNDFTFFRPDFRVLVKFKASETLRLIYRSTRQFTDVNNLAEGYIFRNYNSFLQGNPNLEAASFNAFNLNYQSINIFNFTNIFANISYSERDDAIQNVTNIEGINSVNTSSNSNFPRINYSANGRIDKRFKNFKSGLNINFNYSDFNNLINGFPTESSSFNQSYRFNIATNFRTKPNIEIGYSYNKRDYNTGENNNFFYTDSPYARVDAYFAKGFVFNAKYTYNYYRNEQQTLNEYRFLEADLVYAKSGSQWEFGVGVTNLFDDRQINRDSFNQFYSSTRSYVIQPRYTVFKIKYDIRTVGGSKK
tara:strand:- start:136 stop:2850 length:2715 start_codon:yes stop_codon:yes gene_type:complete